MAQERDYLDTTGDEDDVLEVRGTATATTSADADEDGAAETEQIKEQIA
jgi:hypothetical protein